MHGYSIKVNNLNFPGVRLSMEALMNCCTKSEQGFDKLSLTEL